MRNRETLEEIKNLLFKIAFVLLAGFVVQYLFTIPTWFKYGDSESNWFVTDLTRVCRIFIIIVSVIVSIKFILPSLWGLWIFAIDIGTNIITVISDYGFINKYDYQIFWTRKAVLLIGLIVSTYQILKIKNTFTKEE